MYDAPCVAEQHGQHGVTHRRKGTSACGVLHSRDLARWRDGEELLSIELLEEHARRLAALLSIAPRRGGSGRAHLRQLKEHMRALRDVYTALAEDARHEAMSPAAEWLLDNFHIISAAARDIHHDLPPSFFKRLPRIAADEFAGLPRIYALALELIGSQRGPARRAAASTVHQRLPVRHAAHDGRALGMAERAEARAARPPARESATCSPPAARIDSRRIGWPRRSKPRPVRSTSGRRTSITRLSRACFSARAPSARSRRGCTTSSKRRWRRAARRSRTRFERKDSTRRPNRPAWPT